MMDDDLLKTGMARRRATLGDNYVDRAVDAADDLTLGWQEAMTAWCWGFGWGDDAIDARTRSLMNLAMLGAMGRMEEWKIHCRGAIRNGVTENQVRAACHAVGIYAGVPLGNVCLRAAREVLQEDD